MLFLKEHWTLLLEDEKCVYSVLIQLIHYYIENAPYATHLALVSLAIDTPGNGQHQEAYPERIKELQLEQFWFTLHLNPCPLPEVLELLPKWSYVLIIVLFVKCEI